MFMRLCVLASGSKGNCIYVGSRNTSILIDAGISGKATVERLNMVGIDPQTVKAICLTHEHDDHKSAVGILHRKLGVELYANDGTVEAVSNHKKYAGLPWNIFSTGQTFQIGDLELLPFRVPHDSYDPVGFVISNGTFRVGVVTDMGIVTDQIRDRLRNCSALVIEANHDEELLKASDRPWALKQRIAGRQGHLSNSSAGELVAEVAGNKLRTVLLAHLSSDCNVPDLALRTVQAILHRAGRQDIDVQLTYAERPSSMIVVD